MVHAPFKEFLANYPYPIKLAPFDGQADYRLICDGNGHLVRKVAEINGLVLEDDLPRLSLPTAPVVNDPYYLICAEASTTDRQWQPDRWEELVNRLDAPVIQVGKWGKAPVRGASDEFLGTKLDPPKLASLIKFAKAFITVDTGLSHLAAAIQKPYVVLMDRIPPAWRMHRDYTRPIHKNDVRKITVNEVLEETTKHLGQHDERLESWR